MLWVILIAVVVCAGWVANAGYLNAKETRDQLQRQHEEQMGYLRYLKDLVAASRSEIREAAGLPSFGEELVARIKMEAASRQSPVRPDEADLTAVAPPD